MKKMHWGRVAVLTVLVPVALVYWPLGCSGHNTHASAPVTEPGTVVSQTAAKAPVSFLPHPAFAYASSNAAGSPSIADITERALPSVVSVSSSRVVKRNPALDDPFFRHFFGPSSPDQEDQKEHGLGSGVIVSADGIVLTNNHVIDKADEIKVATADNREFDVEVVGADEKSDLAVLRLKGDTHGLVPIKFADSTRLRLGDVVLAIGNPFGVGETVTMGIVSAKGRSNMGIEDYEDFIQTDAAINPGNSGGALINMEGDLVGINTAILSRSGGSMGIGFAIPSNMAKPISQSLLEKGKVIRGWLGIGIQDVDSELAKALNLDGTSGVAVTEVMNGSPAAKAGLQRGDVITTINGEKVDSTGRLRNLVAEAGATQVKVALIRQGKKIEVNVALGEAPTDKVTPGKAAVGTALNGLRLEPLNDANRGKFEIDSGIKTGVVVVGIEPGSSIADSGLRPGDVIVEINHQPASSVESVMSTYQKAKGRSLLVINRGGNTLFLVLKKG